jgi:hypothetical protein
LGVESGEVCCDTFSCLQTIFHGISNDFVENAENLKEKNFNLGDEFKALCL